MKTIPVLLFLYGYFLPQASALAAAYQTATVHSVYLDPSNGLWQRPKDWIFQADPLGNTTIRENLDAQPLVSLSSDSEGLTTLITKHLNRGSADIEMKESATGPIILSAGYPVPYDRIFPCPTENAPVSFKNTVAGVTFTTALTCTTMPITQQEALTAGMLTGDSVNASAQQNLSLIIVVKSGKLEVRQLWSAGEAFWLYEETQTRKSWRKALTVTP